jgi:uncharacterized protein (UPF0297 family)
MACTRVAGIVDQAESKSIVKRKERDEVVDEVVLERMERMERKK